MRLSIIPQCATYQAAYVVGILRSLIPADARISMSGFVIQVAYRFSRVGPHLEPRLAHRPHSSVAFPACVAHHVVSMPDSCTSQPPRLTPLAENVLQSMYSLAVGEATTGAKWLNNANKNANSVEQCILDCWIVLSREVCFWK